MVHSRNCPSSLVMYFPARSPSEFQPFAQCPFSTNLYTGGGIGVLERGSTSGVAPAHAASIGLSSLSNQGPAMDPLTDWRMVNPPVAFESSNKALDSGSFFKSARKALNHLEVFFMVWSGCISSLRFI